MFQIFKAIFDKRSKAAQARIDAARNRAKPQRRVQREMCREREAYFELVKQIERSLND